MKPATKTALYVGGGLAAVTIAWLWWRQSGISLALRGLPPGVGRGPQLGRPNFSAPPQLTRASCLECVDKHLGAALILITETRDGYGEHRLRAIGHLHEAEDESQAFPMLHDAIRVARKDYQQNGIVPAFDALNTLSLNARR